MYKTINGWSLSQSQNKGQRWRGKYIIWAPQHWFIAYRIISSQSNLCRVISVPSSPRHYTQIITRGVPSSGQSVWIRINFLTSAFRTKVFIDFHPGHPSSKKNSPLLHTYPLHGFNMHEYRYKCI